MSTGYSAPFQKHASKCKKTKTLRALIFISFRSLQNVHWTFCNSNSRKPFKKGLTLNFAFYKRNKSKVLTDGAPLSFIYNNCSTSKHSSKTKFCTKVLCLLSFKKVSQESKLKSITPHLNTINVANNFSVP